MSCAAKAVKAAASAAANNMPSNNIRAYFQRLIHRTVQTNTLQDLTAMLQRQATIQRFYFSDTISEVR